MCGIFAAYQSNPYWDEKQLITALHTLQSRGPDASGTWIEDGLFLGHHRLSIIDLKSGAQPMKSIDGRYIISFNGEIYNYRELRSQLESFGQTFATASDTEVIIECYRRWGDACTTHLAGMYAFVIWDRQERVLFAARDRLGIKPLCWQLDKGRLLIASTLEPLYCLPGLDLSLDYDAVRDVLVYDYVPSPRTMVRGVHKLPPGHTLRWRPSDPSPQISPYWTIPGAIEAPHQQEIADSVEGLLDSAVKRQLVSDVPIGAFLSGGIDSSLVVAFMAQHSSKPVKTFSVRFRQGSDESPIARQVAEAFGTDHTILDAEDVNSAALLDIITQVDEPLSDPALIPTVALARLTKQHVTVALSGDGGDEIFGGYPKYFLGEDSVRNKWYPWSRPAKWLIDSFPGRPRGIGRIYWHSLTPHEQIQYKWTQYGSYPVFRKDLRQVMSSDALLHTNLPGFFDNWHEHSLRWGKTYDSDTLMRTDLVTYLSENCLFKTDRASMIASLEVRVPFLDELILDQIIPLPMHSKTPNKQLKALLMPVAQKLLPRTVWDRPKHGFSVPLGKNMQTNWREAVTSLLDWGQRNAPIFNYAYLDQLVKLNDRTGSVDRELWSPTVILAWLQSRRSAVRL